MIKAKNSILGLFSIIALSNIIVYFLNISFGLIYDTAHFADTFFLLGAGWRVFNGLTPVINFGHFYGGVVEQGIGATMLIFGPGAFVFEYFKLLLFAALILTALVIFHGRMSPAGMSALIVTIGTLLLTLYPLEINEPIIRIVSTHSFLYNRVGFSLFLLCGLYVALRAATGRADMLPGALVGLLVVFAALTKPSFVVLAPAVLLGLALQRRWHGLGAVFAGIAVAVLVMDPMFVRFQGSLSYAQAQVGAEPSAQLSFMLRKALQLPFSQPVSTLFALVALAFMALVPALRTAVLGTLVVTAAGIGMAVTMGGNGNVGQLSLPVSIMMALAASESMRGASTKGAAAARFTAFALVAAFALPHSLNLAAATAEGMARSDRLLISKGPYTRYLSLPEQVEDGVPTQYEMLADGIMALHALGNPSRWGVVADSGITFEHAVLGRPVPGYPLWQRVTAPELAPDRPIASEVDIVMIGVRQTDPVGKLLLGKLGEGFRACTTTAHWKIYARFSSGIACASAPQ